MRWTTEQPSSPGWYWCRGPGDDERGWEAVVRVDEYEADGIKELGCSWLSSPTEAAFLLRGNWGGEEIEWAGPLAAPGDGDLTSGRVADAVQCLQTPMDPRHDDPEDFEKEVEEKTRAGLVLVARNAELEGHLNWLGWDSDGVEWAKKRIADLEQVLSSVAWQNIDGTLGLVRCGGCGMERVSSSENHHEANCPIAKVLNPGTTNRATQ